MNPSRIRIRRRVAAAAAVVAVTCVGMPGASAQDVPAYGTITIIDQGFGPRATWTYDGVLSCYFSTNGPAGVASIARVFCNAMQSPVSLNCPLMIVTRTTLTVVGARARCGSTLDMGVGTSGAASANLGHVDVGITCEAYVVYGVLVAPYSVTCNEPGPPTFDTSLPFVSPV
ncbi:MAG TPA: hypothetical protein VNA20_06195 [Frankiaceae bacterium]|nr:hypothetical protein [Frankiaceae bacterium]